MTDKQELAEGHHPTPREAAELLRMHARQKRLPPNDNDYDDAAGILDALVSELAKVTAERDEARKLADRLKLEAQSHAQEARTANSTIYEIYQVLSGGKGESGNWHGAEPARAYVASRTTVIEAAIEAIDAAGYYIDRLRTAYAGRPVRDMEEAGTAYYRLAGVAVAQFRSLIAGKETDDMVLVPRKPTEAMETAARKFIAPYHDTPRAIMDSCWPKDMFRLAYKAMIAAPPKDTRNAG